jgi:GAF domain-containing protein
MTKNIIDSAKPTLRERAMDYPDIIQNITEQANLATDIAAKLRACTEEQQIFETAVRWARQGTGCDRAVIYSLQAQDRGMIVAEAVQEEYPKTLGRTILDPCFEARYIDQYQQGRVRAIANIQQAGMTPCYIENLEKIGVKATLVVPVLGAANRLHGLLVLHQCSSTRSWSQADIDLAIHIATHGGYALEYLAQVQECDRLRAEIQKAAAWQRILPKIEKKLLASRSRLEVLQIAVQQAQQLLQCDRVVAYSLQASSQGKIIAEATQSALAPIVGRTIYDPCFDYRYIEKYQNGRVRAIDNIYQAGMTPCYVETLSSIGVKSNLAAPILVNGQLIGLLVAHHCFDFRAWQPAEVEKFEQLANQTGLALAAARMQEKQAKLQTTVAVLTEAEGNLRSALRHSNQIDHIAENFVTILAEVSTLSRLLQQESAESHEQDPAAAQRLLQIIARRLQNNVETWQALQVQWPLQQSEVTRLLNLTLAAINAL